MLNSRAETWKEFPLGYQSKFRYAVSNLGRLKSFTDDIHKGRILEGGSVDGYKIFRFRIYRNKKVVYKALLFHHLVAALFIPKKSDDQKFVLHVNYDRSNNHVDNLRWATQEEMNIHTHKSPAVAEGRKRTIEFNRKRDGHKLTSTQVIHIKKMLVDPQRRNRLTLIAKRFGVTTMTLHRIRTGENWSHIKI